MQLIPVSASQLAVTMVGDGLSPDATVIPPRPPRPPVAASDSPAFSDPALIDHVYGGVPPAAARVLL